MATKKNGKRHVARSSGNVFADIRLPNAEEKQTKAAEEVVRVLSGQPPRNPVNPEALAAPRGK